MNIEPVVLAATKVTTQLAVSIAITQVIEKRFPNLLTPKDETAPVTLKEQAQIAAKAFGVTLATALVGSITSDLVTAGVKAVVFPDQSTTLHITLD